MAKRYESCSFVLDTAPAQTSGVLQPGTIAGVSSTISAGRVLVPSGANRGVWNVSSGSWTAYAAAANAPLQVMVNGGDNNGLWVLEANHTDASAYASPVGA